MLSNPPSAFRAINGQTPSCGESSRPVWHPRRRVARVSRVLGSKGGLIPTMARQRALPARMRASSSQVAMACQARPSLFRYETWGSVVQGREGSGRPYSLKMTIGMAVRLAKRSVHVVVVDIGGWMGGMDGVCGRDEQTRPRQPPTYFPPPP